MPHPDSDFDGAIPALYERELVPMIFQPYADDAAARLAAIAPSRVLEVAAGTGVLTRALALRLPGSTRIVATDLNPPMLAQAQARGTARPVEWRVADAMALPFDDGAFDAVACQFGAMFFPDRAHAFAEARRVLATGGHLLFSVWDRIGTNDFAQAVTVELARLFPGDPPDFMARVPHGYHEPAAIRADLAAAGFDRTVDIRTVAHASRAPGPEAVALAYCQGTPLRNEIEARAPGRLAAVTAAVAAGLASRLGDGPLSGRIQALTVEAR